MYKSILYSLLKRKYNVTDSTIKLLDCDLKVQEYIKGEDIIRQGYIHKDIYFLIKGLAITYLTRDDKDYVTSFSSEGDVIFMPLRKVSLVTLTAIEDCIVLRMNYSKFEGLMGKHADIAIMGYKIFKRLLLLTTEDFFSFTGLDATDIYERVVKEKPEVVNRVPLKYIASKIGVTPSSLSRIRSAAFKHKK
ncbi:MAG: Crp/Fnr family transcriptional regulator [Bacteroidales bacterium]